MPAQWTGDLVGKMHCNRIMFEDLANELGITRAYVSMILNGKKDPKGMQEKMENAVDAIIQRRAQK